MSDGYVHLVQIVTTRIKSNDETDVVNFGKKIKTSVYYAGRDKFRQIITTKEAHEATFLTETAAHELANKLNKELVSSQRAEVTGWSSGNHEAYPCSLEECGETPYQPKQSTQSVGLELLQKAVAQCFDEKMSQLDILTAVGKELF